MRFFVFAITPNLKIGVTTGFQVKVCLLKFSGDRSHGMGHQTYVDQLIWIRLGKHFGNRNL